jgi:OOP family OmpA-OmpF porin
VFQRAEKLLAPPQGVQLSLEQSILTAKGEAGHAWINAFNTRAKAIPGIDAADGSALVNTDRTALLTALKALTSMKIYFENDSTEIVPGQEDRLNRMIDTIRRLNRQMSILNLSVPVTIVGHADSSGTDKYNLKLSRERAEKIYGFVKSRGLSYGFISTVGVGNQVRLKEETGEEDRQFNRAVSFRAIMPSHNDNGAAP